MPLALPGFESVFYCVFRNVTGPLKVRTDIFAPPPFKSVVRSAPRPKRPGFGLSSEILFETVPAIVTIESDAFVF
jgi:hypothetical protein